MFCGTCKALQWRHYGHDGVSHHQPRHCLFNRLYRRRSKKTSKLRVTGLCAGNSPVTGEFHAQRASNAENISIWWRHLAYSRCTRYLPEEPVMAPDKLVTQKSQAGWAGSGGWSWICEGKFLHHMFNSRTPFCREWGWVDASVIVDLIRCGHRQGLVGFSIHFSTG